MYELNDYRVNIRVNLVPGFYGLQENSATGKTYLAHLLKNYRTSGAPVGSYNYSDFVSGVKIGSVLNRDLKLFMLDRLDMYYLKFSKEDIEVLKGVLDTTIVIADLKGRDSVTWPVISAARINFVNQGLIKVGAC